MRGESRRGTRVLISALASCVLAVGVVVLRNPSGAGAGSHLAVDAAPLPAADPTTVVPPTAGAVPPPATVAPTTAPTVTPTTARPSSPPTTRAPTAAPATTRTTAPAAPAPAPTAAASLAPDGASGHYAFLSHDGTRPMRYDPCTPIHYVVNAAQAPPTGLADLQGAVQRLSAASGLTFVFDGLTDEVPVAHRGMAQSTRYPHGWPPVLIGWAQRAQTDLFKNAEVGEGGSTWYGVPGAEVYVTGVVAVDAARDDTLAPGFGGNSMGALLMHELGHVVGLDHVDDPTQLMYPSVTAKPARYGSGDLAGLQEVGRPAGCLSVPVAPWGA